MSQKHKLNKKKFIFFIIFVFASLAILIYLLISLFTAINKSIQKDTVLVSSINYNNNVNETYDINDNTIQEILTTEEVDNQELNEAKIETKEIKKSTSPYYIKVNYGANVVTIYAKDQNDDYTVPYKAMVCSCGTFTPKDGTYKTLARYRWLKLYHDCYGQYATRIVSSILFHSVPYDLNSNDSLQYEEYDKLRFNSICWLC